MLSGENRRRASGTGRAHRLSIRSTPEIRYGSNGFRTLTCVEVPLRSHSILSADTRPKFCAALVPSSPNQERPRLEGTFHAPPNTARGFAVESSGSARRTPPCVTVVTRRSEEHTSELQSRFDLVCRLLLAKKNTYT